MVDHIGNVRLNEQYYSGSDGYSDGDVEDLLLAAVKNGSDLQEVIKQNPSWPVFYHLSDMRGNVLNWIPFQKTDEVLEIGAGCGAVTGVLLARCKEVVCVELSKKRSLINAYRHKDARNLEIITGNFSDVRDGLNRKFDYITLIGVYEYAALYSDTEHPHQTLLRQLKPLLKPGGRLVIAIENRLGLKYFAGCREDHLGTYFQGIEKQYFKGGVCTFDKTALTGLLETAGFAGYEFYYPYPDYKLPEAVYSDDYLPKKGELVNNLRNFDADRLVVFDETKVWDGILDAGLFAHFSNSFLVLASVQDRKDQADKVVFAKFASQRTADYQIVTKIIRNNSAVVKKTALTEQAAAHIQKMRKAYERLSQLFAPSAVRVAVCTRKEPDSIEMPFVQGTNLESLLEEYVSHGRQEQAANLMKYFFAQFLERAETVPFQKTDAFTQVFGKAEGLKAQESLAVTNADCIFSNFLVKGHLAKWEFVMLDYEWTFYFPIPLEFVLFRALFHSYAFQKLEKKYQTMLFLCAGIAKEEEKSLYLDMEYSFQKYVRGSRPETGQLYRTMHTHAWNVRQMDPKMFYTEYQVYFDDQPGQWEDTPEREITVRTAVLEGTKRIRIVLNNKNGVYKIHGVYAQDGAREIKDFESNAQLQILDDYYFTQIPELEIENRQYREIILKYQVVEAGSSCMEQMIGALKNAQYYREAYDAAQQAAEATERKKKEYEQAYDKADRAWKEYEQAYHMVDEEKQVCEQAYLEAEKKCAAYAKKCQLLEEELEQIHNSLWWKLGSKIGRYKK